MTEIAHGAWAEQLVTRHFDAMAEGSLADLVEVVHPEATNREARIEPPECRGRGPGAYLAASNWLRHMAPDIGWDIHEVVARDDLVAVHCTMRGHQTGDHTYYDRHGRPAQVMPASRRQFMVTQSHWLRLSGGMIIEHWATRDDLTMAMQLGWLR